MEFNRLADYADIIKQTNLGSSCWIRTDSETLPSKKLFVYFYLCLDALKREWLEGCRRIIGFDGCFLKEICKGELLVAVGRNGNNQMFPIAWAVVDQETKHSWRWFITYLIADLQLGNGVRLIVMSYMQKGLIPTIRELLPMAEHRMCARHIWSNWSKTEEVKKGGNISVDVPKDLMKAYFREDSKCDVIENNMCETFNSWIVGPRHKSIITMLEEIRHKIMNRTIKMRKFVETWVTDIAPMARMILEENKALPRRCKVMWNAEHGFEVDEGVYRFIVDFSIMTCTCRSWMLRGIPCQHTVCAFYDIEMDPEDYVSHWYRKETFLKAYQHFIQPISNMKMWPDSSNPCIEPPKPKPMPGRPKRCKRKAKDKPRKKYGGPGLGREKGRGTTLGGGSANATTIGHKRPRHTGFGIFTDTISGTTILNPGILSERVILARTFKDTSATNLDIGFKLPGLKFKGRNAVTRSQL
ncbi:uncharacterized protein LOC142177079 [Nicotiana tabacum]|uniref:Uncharacterized protein LOC142177079 n=1 Tax=Nicotiana tabacum TaxID=4097 RepID=A0AC58TWL8_TOBAC